MGQGPHKLTSFNIASFSSSCKTLTVWPKVISLCLGFIRCESFNWWLWWQHWRWRWRWPCWSRPVGLSGVWCVVTPTCGYNSTLENCRRPLHCFHTCDLRLNVFIPDLHCTIVGHYFHTWFVICFSCTVLLSYLICALFTLHSPALLLHFYINCTALHFATLLHALNVVQCTAIWPAPWRRQQP